MPNCQDIESTLAAYVEGECPSPDRNAIDAHLRACPACRARMVSERTACELLRARRMELRTSAPEALHRRCAAQRAASAPLPGRRVWVPLSMAATLVLAAGLLVLFGPGSSVHTYAAQLAVDHMKCFRNPPDGQPADAAELGERWRGAGGWPLRIAPGAAAEGLELIGMRRCASTRGRVAHMLYRWRGQPLSVYVLNGYVEHHAAGLRQRGRAPDAYDAVRTLGTQEIIWSDRGRTYAVVAQASAPELQRVAVYVRRLTE